MTREEFRADLAQYSMQELRLIAATQTDVYSPQEMEIIREELDARKDAEREQHKKRDANDTLPCILSLLLPVIGFLIATIFMHSDDPVNRQTGKRCMIAAFVSLMLFSFIMSSGIFF